ncbi:MAG: quinolinate synthase NadA [Hadesarchaea archaeon]|nr:quinolinate synthase NadA [Hadesarchaea archaeon]
MSEEELKRKISKLKEEKNAVILAHNYQVEPVQLIADYLGDSLGLARKSSETDADIVVFAGVDFMAETASVLNPDKKILIPDREAQCPMAAMLPAEEVKKSKERHPEAAVVLYVNTLAEARAEADITCTSANSVQVVNSLDEDKVLFGPDQNLAWYVKQNTDKEIITIPEDGHCYVHKRFDPADIELLIEENPDAEVLVHPEASPDVQELADYICSTSQMLSRAEESDSKKFIITTEIGLVKRLRREIPNKEFIPALSDGICKQMKKHSLKKIYQSLFSEEYEIKVSREIAEKVRTATERMLEVS